MKRAKKQTQTSVRDFLKKRGCPAHVVEAGLEGLLAGWERTVEGVAGGYKGDLEEYLNELDGRQILQDARAVAPPSAKSSLETRLSAADSRMKELTAPIESCLWGDSTAKKHGWTAQSSWWYFAKPRIVGE